MGIPRTRAESILANHTKKCWVCCHSNCNGCVIKKQVKDFVFSRVDGVEYKWANPNTPKEMHTYICAYRGKLKARKMSCYIATPVRTPARQMEPASSVRYAMMHPCRGGSMSSK